MLCNLYATCKLHACTLSFEYYLVSGEIAPRADQSVLLLRRMQVTNVPNSDGDSLSDPYLKVHLLECDAGLPPSSRSSRARYAQAAGAWGAESPPRDPVVGTAESTMSSSVAIVIVRSGRVRGGAGGGRSTHPLHLAGVPIACSCLQLVKS